MLGVHLSPVTVPLRSPNLDSSSCPRHPRALLREPDLVGPQGYTTVTHLTGVDHTAKERVSTGRRLTAWSRPRHLVHRRDVTSRNHQTHYSKTLDLRPLVRLYPRAVRSRGSWSRGRLVVEGIRSGDSWSRDSCGRGVPGRGCVVGRVAPHGQGWRVPAFLPGGPEQKEVTRVRVSTTEVFSGVSEAFRGPAADGPGPDAPSRWSNHLSPPTRR